MRLTQRGSPRHSGFTLIELLMVIVIVAVLATIALPAYQDYVIKANRGAAQSYLMEVAQKQQLYFNDTRAYATDPNELNLFAPERVTDNYTIAFDANDVPPAFSVTATATGRQAKDGNLTIDHTGAKTRAGTEAW